MHFSQPETPQELAEMLTKSFCTGRGHFLSEEWLEAAQIPAAIGNPASEACVHRFAAMHDMTVEVSHVYERRLWLFQPIRNVDNPNGG